MLYRLISLIPTLLAISLLVFLVLRLIPGDPVAVMYGLENGVTVEAKTALEKKLGLDQPVAVQYFKWLWRFVRGEWGHSYFSGVPVSDLILQRLPWTFLLTTVSILIGLLISVPLGAWAALKPANVLSHVVLAFALIAHSTPSFLIGITLILLFSFWFPILPSFGAVDLSWDIGSVLRHLILPSLTLGIGIAGLLTRLVRASLVQELGLMYVTSARARGIPERGVVLHHAFRNALTPILTVTGVWFVFAISGSVVVETLFAWPGIGSLLYRSVISRDYPVIQSTVMLVAIFVVVINAIVDLLYMMSDPRTEGSL